VARIILLHQTLSDEKSIKPGLAQPNEILARSKAGLADGDSILRNCLHQFERCFQMYAEVLQVAIVDAYDLRAG
jgi:hypothetical protein